jgi:hypothetical protein
MNSGRLLALQRELYLLLQKTPNLEVPLKEPCWSNQEFREIIWVVKNFVNQSDDVIQDSNPLVNWLDKYQFFLNAGH